MCAFQYFKCPLCVLYAHYLTIFGSCIQTHILRSYILLPFKLVSFKLNTIFFYNAHVQCRIGETSKTKDFKNIQATGVEKRTSKPKPKWNMKLEHIRILESLFNFGVVNLTSKEIRRIRIRLEEYEEVGDINVFY